MVNKTPSDVVFTKPITVSNWLLAKYERTSIQVNLDMTDHCTTDFWIWRTICLVPVRCISSIRHAYTTDFAYDGPVFLAPLTPSYPSSPVLLLDIHNERVSVFSFISQHGVGLVSSDTKIERNTLVLVIWSFYVPQFEGMDSSAKGPLEIKLELELLWIHRLRSERPDPDSENQILPNRFTISHFISHNQSQIIHEY